MSTIKDLKAYAKQIGATVDILQVRGRWDGDVFPPEGKQWREGGGLPFLVVHQLPGRSESDLFDDILARMREGLEDVP